MKRMLLVTMLFTFVLASVANAQTRGWMSRYWDGCKPSCSWSGKQYTDGVGQCKECNKQNQLMATSDQNRSSCDGGNSYTCWDMVPWQPDPTGNPNLAYAFAATPSDKCGQCFELEFDGGFQHGNAGQTHQALKGKKLIVMGSNMGGDVHATQFDVLIPGGGVGQFDSFSGQIGNNNLGERYGGLLAACGNPSNLSEAQTCLRNRCNTAFGASGQDWLKAGCNFYADWFMAANNPTMTFKTVSCPQALKDRYQKAATGGPGTVTPPTTTTYTLTINRSPSNTGTVTGAGTHNANTAVAINATAPSGYRFVNWTAGSGATIANVNSASTTVTLTANATITANFQQTYTLTVNRDPTAGGTTNPSGDQTNIAAGTQVNISATPASGYTFTNWTIATGSGTLANANSASTSITVNGNVTVRANFTAIPTQPTNYTLTINRNPTAGGTVTGAGSVAAGTPINISATANSGYTFSGWTVTGSNASIANANSASTTVTLTANATITANFTQNSTTPTNYTLTINRSPTAGGSVTGAGSVAAGAQRAITATAASGYTFSNWTITGNTASIANVNNASTTVTLTGNATITANFTQQQGGGGTCTGVILTRNIVPEGSGAIEISPDKGTCYTQGDAITVKAVANAGWEFDGWEGDGTWQGAPADLGSTSMWWHRTLTAYFKKTDGDEGGGENGGGVVGPPPGMRSEVTVIEAEDYDSKEGNFQIGEENADGIICIGWIENGHRANYKFTALKAVATDTSNLATLQFHVATGNNTATFTVWVNGTQTGRITIHNTGGWDSYTLVQLAEDAILKTGENTIELRFESSVNVDYIQLLTKPGTLKEAPVSIRHATKPAPQTGVKVWQVASGMLNVDLGYTPTSPVAFQIYDLKGKLVSSEMVNTRVANVKVNVSNGVYLLKVGNKSMVKVLK